METYSSLHLCFLQMLYPKLFTVIYTFVHSLFICLFVYKTTWVLAVMLFFIWIEMRDGSGVCWFYGNFSPELISLLSPQLWFTATLNVNIQSHQHHICLHLTTGSYKGCYRHWNAAFLIIYKIMFLIEREAGFSVYSVNLLKSIFRVNTYYRQ